MIDRKYNRTADTGRFELIHRGTPVPVPIYVGIDLRVEGKNKFCFRFNIIKINLGKPLKTGRPTNSVPSTIIGTPNNNNNILHTPVSAPPQTHLSSSSSSTSNTPAEIRPAVPQSASALSMQHQTLSSKTSNSPATFKFRREMTQPTISRAELMSSLDYPLEKIATNDNFPNQYRSNIIISKSYHNQQADIRHKQLKINASRLSVDYVPIRQISRSRVNDCLPSPKGKKIKKIFFFFFILFSLLKNVILKINCYFLKI